MDNVLLIDVGTNGEMALGNCQDITCCSTAAGPAFEGSEIDCGMIGAAGAINRVYLEDDDICFSTIGDIPAKGICGSGLIDAVAVLLQLGIIDKTGRMVQEKYYFTDDVYISQKDIRKVQVAKSAIASGFEVLTSKSDKQISEVLLAGGFGSYINVESACAIGMLPQEFLPITRQVGNTALKGAAMLLCDCSYINNVRFLKQKAHYIELSNDRQFNELYINNMSF